MIKTRDSGYSGDSGVEIESSVLLVAMTPQRGLITTILNSQARSSVTKSLSKGVEVGWLGNY